jgi:hypothetical protein
VDYNYRAIPALIEYIQKLYDESGRPPGRILFRYSAGWYVRLARGRYERLGRSWVEVEYSLKTGVKRG